jgi:twitching motility protein PilT
MNLDQLLTTMYEKKSSDLHLRVGAPPLLRINGILSQFGEEKLSIPEMKELREKVLTEKQKKTLEDELAVDSSYSIEGFKRFRLNVFFQRGTLGMVFRNIATEIPTIESLDLPQVLKTFCRKPQGLVLVAGPTGSGKSSSLAAMMNHINDTQCLHVVTIEDPIEFLFKDKMSFITQRELGIDTNSYEDALKNAMRQDPDVMLVGEIRTVETMKTALNAAETGHLVFSTVHANSSYEAISRIVGAFPDSAREQVRRQLAEVLIASLFQKLIPSADGKSRKAAVEVLIKTPRIKKLIDDNELQDIRKEIEDSVVLHKMQTIEQSLIALIANKKIRYEDAIHASLLPGELKLIMDQLGISEKGDISFYKGGKNGATIEF